MRKGGDVQAELGLLGRGKPLTHAKQVTVLLLG